MLRGLMSKGNVLVVDDTPASLRLLVDILSGEGYTVRPADCGPLALTSATANPPALIVLDIRMPGMDGFEVCRELRQRPETRELPVIFLSAANETSERIEGLKLGAVDFVTKPFQREELIARINTHVELGRLRTRLERLVEERTAELDAANEQLRIAALTQRAFLRDVLCNVTEGRLVFCDSADELPPVLHHREELPLSSATGLRELRLRTRQAAAQAGLADERLIDLVAAASEAGMRALVHVGSGVATISHDDDGAQVRIDDAGQGISLAEIPQATLRKGYSTAGTLGHGMKMMINMSDRLYLMTGPTGTTVVLEQGKEPSIDFRFGR